MPGQGNSRGAVRLVAEIAAVLSIAAGVVHISAAGDHTELPVLFAGFIVVALLQLALGAVLLWRGPSRPLVAAGLALMVGSIGAWLLSRTAGLPFIEDGHQEAVGFKDGVTVLFELGAIPALLLLLSRELDRVALPSARFAGRAFRGVTFACFLMLVPALMLGSGGPRSHEEAVALGLHARGESHNDSEDQEPTRAHPRASEATAHDVKDRRRKSPGHDGSPDAEGSGGRSGHSLASAPAQTGHDEPAGKNAPGEPRNHAKKDGDPGGGGHRDREKDHGRGDDKRDGEHGENGEDGGDQSDEPPVSVGYEPLRVCVSGVCVP